MSTSTPVRSNNTLSAIIGIGAVVVILVVLGQSGWLGGDRHAPEEEPGEPDRVLATFEVVWGEVIDTGETYRNTGKAVTRLECHDRELEIVISVDGEEEVMAQHASDAEEECTFRHHRPVPRGSELVMTVREVEVYGWKMATLHIDGHMALPNGFAISPDDRPVQVWGIAL